MVKAELESALAKGTRLAVRRAVRWSNGELWPGDTGAENLIQVSVADAIYRGATVKPVIHLEPTLARIDETAFQGDARRVDVGLKWKTEPGGKPRYFSVIEIKKHPVPYVADLQKICDLLDRSDSLRHGYLVTYFQKYDANRHSKLSLDGLVARAEGSISEAFDKLRRHSCAHLRRDELGRMADQAGTWRAAALITRFERQRA
jgi:hypothetical protein